MAKPFQFLAGAASDGQGFLPAVTCLESTGGGDDDNVIHWLLYQPSQQFPDQHVAVAVAETELSGAFANPLVMASDRALATYLQARGFVEVEVPDDPQVTHIDTKALVEKAGEEPDQAAADSTLTNPVLQALILQTIDSQILGNDPPEARETLQRLVGQGFTPDQAKSLIGAAIANEIFDLYEHRAPFNRERYVENLKKLPFLPERGEQTEG